MKILIVDDEKLLVKGMRFNLEQDGYQVETAYDGEEAIKAAKDRGVDLIILDLMLPKVDGLTVCQKVREFSSVPIIMLTAKADDIDKIMGFEYGADDYLTKPFNVLELKARVKALLRRAGNQPQQQGTDKSHRKAGELELDYNFRRIHTERGTVELTAKEFDLMDLFMSNPSKVYSRENLLNIIWGYEYTGEFRTVDVHIRRLREKIEPNPADPTYIKTQWGVGYYFNAN